MLSSFKFEDHNKVVVIENLNPNKSHWQDIPTVRITTLSDQSLACSIKLFVKGKVLLNRLLIGQAPLSFWEISKCRSVKTGILAHFRKRSISHELYFFVVVLQYSRIEHLHRGSSFLTFPKELIKIYNGVLGAFISTL